jgi:integrase
MSAPWTPPCDPADYDRSPQLAPAERRALADLAGRQTRPGRTHGAWPRWVHAALARLGAPLDAVLAATLPGDWRARHAVRAVFVAAMHQRQVAFWGWTRDEWLATARATDAEFRQAVLAAAYHLCGQTDLHAAFPKLKRRLFAERVFGREPVEAAVGRVGDALRGWGCGPKAVERCAPTALCELLLRRGSPRLEDLDPATLAARRDDPARPASLLYGVRLVGQALALLGHPGGVPPSAAPGEVDWPAGTAAARADVPAAWAEWCMRWFRTATQARKSRETIFYYLLKAGRWLAATHPEATDPACWTRELAAEYVAAVDRMRVGEWAHAPATCRYAERLGQPLRARTKDRQLGSLRTFFHDTQEWGWVPHRFDPLRALATPRAVRALIGPDPRVIADDCWAKLLWAGLNLAATDLPRHAGRGEPWYPLELVRAVGLLWLFAGLRNDELTRLRVGCVRWQREDVAVAGTAATLPQDAVCLLDVPAHKTGRPFTKPVDRAVGKAIAAWEAVRPTQLPGVDPKTGEAVHFLFAYRGQRLGRGYLNRVLIPLLCRKANLPAGDARGPFTSHRARSTIATQLYNAREPLTLTELQEWLGHRTPLATQQYAKVAPTRLAKSYADADYFRRNVRRVEVLLDQDAVRDGAAATGEPWRFYDLGHGYCTYDFFDQCPHRMACAKCAFYRPKGSTAAQLLEGKANLLRLQQEIPLTEEERAAVDDGLAALEHLCAQLAAVPTPAGPTPRDLGRGRDGAGLPVLPARGP